MHVMPMTACGRTTVCRVESANKGGNGQCNDSLVDGTTKMAEVLMEKSSEEQCMSCRRLLADAPLFVEWNRQMKAATDSAMTVVF